MGIRTRKGREYHKSQVQHILSNPYYVGINRFDGKEYPGAQEPIIEHELFEKVQQKMHRGRPTVLKKHNPVFKNIIRCKSCAGVVTWQLQKGHYYGSCQRLSDACRGRKLIRQDKVESLVIGMLKRLACPSPEVIGWVAKAMREHHEGDIEGRRRLVASIQMQIDRIGRMDDTLYDDKLSGDISKERYEQKHKQFAAQKDELEEQLAKVDTSAAQNLDQQLVLLELSQKAATLYPSKTPEQKRLIITSLFDSLVLDEDEVVVTYTNFSRAIAHNVTETIKVLGGTEK